MYNVNCMKQPLKLSKCDICVGVENESVNIHKKK